MQRIVLCSRYADVPSRYGAWFSRRLDGGQLDCPAADGGSAWQTVSLHRDDVRGIVFWSRNYRPFMPTLQRLHEAGYPCLLHAIVTGLPPLFEPNAIPWDNAVQTIWRLSSWWPRDRLVWQYGPLLITDFTPPVYHIARFHELAGSLAGRITHCHIRFGSPTYLRDAPYGMSTRDLAPQERVELVGCLQDVAVRHGLTLHLDGPSAVRTDCVHALCGCDPLFVTSPDAYADPGQANICPENCAYCSVSADVRLSWTRYRAQDPAHPALGSYHAIDSAGRGT